MNVFLAFIQLITIILICIYEYKKKYISIFLWGTLLIMYGVPHFLSVVFKKISYDEEVVIKASIFVILFNLLYLFTKFLIFDITKNISTYKTTLVEKIKLHRVAEVYLGPKRDEHLTRVFFALLASCLFILVVSSVAYFGSVFNSSWGNFRRLNKELGFMSPIRYTNFIFFGCAGVALVYKKYNKNIMFIISLMIIVFYSLITGNRITILPALMAIIIPYIFNDKKKLSIKQILFLSFIAFFIIYLVHFLRLLRIYGGFYNLAINFDFEQVNLQVLDMILNGNGGELALRNIFYYFIYKDNNFINFNRGHTYIRLLLIAIPTSLSGGLKSPDFAITMGSAWKNDPYNSSYSVHPTLYGDCFANFWWFGIFLGAFWAALSYMLDNKCVHIKNEVVRSMLMVLWGTVYVIVGRGSVYNGFFIGYAGSIVVGTVYLISKFRIRLQ